LSKLDQVLGGGWNCGIADMRKYHKFSEGFKSADMLEVSVRPGISGQRYAGPLHAFVRRYFAILS